MTSIIRLAQPEDAGQIAAIYAPHCLETPTSFEVTAPTPTEMAQRMCHLQEQFPWLVLEDGSEIAGYVYASPHHLRAAYQWSVNVSAYISPRYQRRGIGRALYTALFRILALQGYHQAIAGITLPNPASVGLHESMGFGLVGVYREIGYKFGAWHDVAWYQLALQPTPSDPPPPLPMHVIWDSSEVQQALGTGVSLYRR